MEEILGQGEGFCCFSESFRPCTAGCHVRERLEAQRGWDVQLCPGWHGRPGGSQQVELPAKGSPGDP